MYSFAKSVYTFSFFVFPTHRHMRHFSFLFCYSPCRVRAWWATLRHMKARYDQNDLFEVYWANELDPKSRRHLFDNLDRNFITSTWIWWLIEKRLVVDRRKKVFFLSHSINANGNVFCMSISHWNIRKNAFSLFLGKRRKTSSPVRRRRRLSFVIKVLQQSSQPIRMQTVYICFVDFNDKWTLTYSSMI